MLLGAVVQAAGEVPGETELDLLGIQGPGEEETLTQGEDYKIKGRRSFEGENNGILKRLKNGNERKYWYWERGLVYTIDYDWGYPEEDRPEVIDSVANEMVINRLNEAAADRKSVV